MNLFLQNALSLLRTNYSLQLYLLIRYEEIIISVALVITNSLLFFDSSPVRFACCFALLSLVIRVMLTMSLPPLNPIPFVFPIATVHSYIILLNVACLY
ncbi:uncharacterized protein V1516DRAFT_673606 [Lipomyces oligophaga]|uniref:uncharacterized protein n=1 Tax=Lipomyces oligophaga TaxID=45792 RepID=UPI0034CDEF59